MRGNNELKPLRYVFKQKTTYPRSLFMISDGGIGTDCSIEEIYKLVSDNVSNTRSHFFGIGASAERDKVIKLAKCGKGAYEFAEENESFRHKVIGVLKKSIMPSLCNWTVSWDQKV